MKALSVAGTAAMFLVGGSIVLHGLPALHHVVQGILASTSTSGWTAALGSMLADAVVGIIVGALVLAVVSVGQRMFVRRPGKAPG